jgi:hypothetical protein
MKSSELALKGDVALRIRDLDSGRGEGGVHGDRQLAREGLRFFGVCDERRTRDSGSASRPQLHWRVPEHLAPLPHDHRHIGDPDLDPIQQVLHVGIAPHFVIAEGLGVPTPRPLG